MWWNIHQFDRLLRELVLVYYLSRFLFRDDLIWSDLMIFWLYKVYFSLYAILFAWILRFGKSRENPIHINLEKSSLSAPNVGMWGGYMPNFNFLIVIVTSLRYLSVTQKRRYRGNTRKQTTERYIYIENMSTNISIQNYKN